MIGYSERRQAHAGGSSDNTEELPCYTDTCGIISD